jgi:hypothetical protein
VIDTEQLGAQIAIWPESVKGAWVHCANAQAEVSRLDQALERTVMAVRLEYAPGDGALGNQDVEGEEAWQEGAPGSATIEIQRRILELDHQVQMALAEVDRAKAACDVRVRSAAQANGLKVTEAAVEARVDTDPAVIVAQDKAIELKHQRAVLKLEHDEDWRTVREQRGLAELEGALKEPEQIRRPRSDLENSRALLASAPQPVRSPAMHGRSLRLLTQMGRLNS